MSFDSTKNTLEKLLEQVDEGSLQLPEFQRDYVWAEEAVVSLLASIAKGYPVGALLLLERGGEVDFQPRLIEGVARAKAAEPDLLLLDGQQRMTSLYQVLWSPRPALLKNARNQKVERHLFIDVGKAVGGSGPSTYLARIEKRPGGSGEALDAILCTHLIDPALLRADDFDNFFTDREARLAALASEAMGKAVVGSEVPEEGISDDGLGLDEEKALEEAA